MKRCFEVFLLVSFVLVFGTFGTCQEDSLSAISSGDLEIFGRILSKSDTTSSSLLGGARIDHFVTYLGTIGTDTTSSGGKIERVYYIAEDGEFYLILESETINTLLFTFPAHYSKSIFIDLIGSSASEYEEGMMLDMDVVLSPEKYRRVKRILENEYVGVGRFDSSLDDMKWDEAHLAKIKKKISRRHWWWPWKIKDS
jgi:hypothetical protein